MRDTVPRKTTPQLGQSALGLDWAGLFLAAKAAGQAALAGQGRAVAGMDAGVFSPSFFA